MISSPDIVVRIEPLQFETTVLFAHEEEIQLETYRASEVVTSKLFNAYEQASFHSIGYIR